ncbi:MAG: N-formylglutamate amidohydrolase [Pseudomonadota bacterium]
MTAPDNALTSSASAGLGRAAGAAPFVPVETVPPGPEGGPGGLGDVVLLCDHARNAVPPELDLGLPASEMARHIAWDVGARGLTLGLAERLGAGAVLSTYSRLVIDPNRGEDDPTLVMKLYDGTIIPGNRYADEAEIARRRDTYYRPYHRAVTAAIDAVEARGGLPALISIHSFTPQLRGRAPRPWHVGLLWDRDDRLFRPLMAALEAEGDLVVGDNEPYTGALANDCLNRHGTGRGLPHILIEIRNDLIADAAGQAAWAARLEGPLRASIVALTGP